MFKLALVQMAVEGGDKWGNLRHAEELIDEACGNGARVVVLPEAVGLGWTDPAAKTEAETIPDGATCRMLGQAARRHGAFVCAGTVERENGAVFNSAVIVDPGGKVVLRHRKLNELDIGFQFYGQGDRLSVCRTELATFGLMICADAFARDFVVSRALGYMGADVILSPCSWAVPADHDNVKDPYGKLWRDSYSPVARQFSLWIVGVSNVGWISGGPWKGRKCIGSSLVVGPDGQVVLQGSYGEDAEETLYVTIDPRERPARGCEWEAYWDGLGGEGLYG